jgi:hypothetical protein
MGEERRFYRKISRLHAITREEKEIVLKKPGTHPGFF